MTLPRDLERRLVDHLRGEAPSRSPDWILRSALMTIDTTRQRRGLTALRRYSSMSSYMKLATAAVVVIAAAGFTLWQLAPRGGGGPSVPTSSPTNTAIPTPTPTRNPATPAPAPTTYAVPQLTGTFTSPQYGYSLSYPQGWGIHAATELWTEGVLPEFGGPEADTVFDVGLEDHLFVGAASQVLNGQTLVAWQGDFLTTEGCGATESIVVDGANGVIGRDCDIALVEAGGRGYIFGLWSSSDDRQLLDLDTHALFRSVLATVQLQPDAAVE
ncbi:MAG TPA: hypothetical protein VM451_04560 [Candidatus Limnocylindria bacterium]|nr:hypothetical protein [Candidatus Limnocylindria bacterium]